MQGARVNLISSQISAQLFVLPSNVVRGVSIASTVSIHSFVLLLQNKTHRVGPIGVMIQTLPRPISNLPWNDQDLATNLLSPRKQKDIFDVSLNIFTHALAYLQRHRTFPFGLFPIRSPIQPCIKCGMDFAITFDMFS